MEADGSNQKQLTFNSGNNIQPSVAIDGSFIVFVSNRTGAFNVWRMDVDGDNPKQLTDGGGEVWPQVSFDNQWIIYESLNRILWKVPANGGVAVQLSNGYAAQPVLTPDRKSLAFYSLDGIYVMPLDGTQPKKIIDVPSATFLSARDIVIRLPLVRWTSDGQNLTYIADHDGLGD
jgi:Tol biopolymer transport system component